MTAEADSTRQGEQPTHEEASERQFGSDVVELFQAWREAGKPHKR